LKTRGCGPTGCRYRSHPMPDRILRTADDVWHPVPGYEGRLEITRGGRVRSVARTVRSRYNSTRRLPTRELKPFLANGGYPAVQVHVGAKRKNVFLHRAIALLFVPNPESKPHVNHLDGNKANCRPENLEWCTHAENMAHAARNGWMKGNSGPGERSPAAKLDWGAVANIRTRLKQRHSLTSIARDFSVSPGTIAFIRDNVTWKI